MPRTMLIVGILVAISAAEATGTIRNVPSEYPTIQAGINSSQQGDTVLVSHGTYYESVLFNGHNVTLASLFLIDREIDHIDSTIIDGNGYNSVIRFQNNEDSTAKVIGFTLQHGQAYYGGGVYCVNSNPTLSHNIITDNSAYGFEVPILGGGAYFSNSSSFVSNNVFKNNMAVGSYGSYGGGAFVDFSNQVLINNIFIYNQADYGGGICCDGMSTLRLVNSILWGNNANVTGDQLLIDDLVWPLISYCDIEDTVFEGEGNVSVYPMFRNSLGNFHLMSSACADTDSSPLIDAGDPLIRDRLLDCAWGLGTLRSDIGAYGGNETAVFIENQESKNHDWISLSQNCPNPFNVATRISYSIAETSFCTLSIFNILGQRVTHLLDDLQQSGEHSIIWNAGSCPSGIYFARLRGGDHIKIVKMVLMK